MNAPAAPLSFGPFELLEQLGGGMSVVYRARRTGDARELAVKLLRQERCLDGEARARFARELRAMQHLSHPGICSLLDAGEIDGIPYLCMPLLRGRSLATHLGEARALGVPVATLLPDRPGGPGGWQRIVAIAITLADALEVAHRHGFVHRDVKPANVWILERGEPLLLDFGLARDEADRYHNLTRTGQIVGTPTYLAPEQLDPGLGAVDGRADVYGLSAVLCEVLTLEPPFRGATRAELFANIVAGQWTRNHLRSVDAPATLFELIEIGMARRPADRHPSAAAMAADLRRVLAGRPLSRRRPGPLRRVAAWVLAQPLRMAVTAVLLLAAPVLTSVLVRLVHAAGASEQLQAASEVQLWLGRYELARSSLAGLPPPWPQHRAALEAWLREHGRPLLAAPAAAARGAPDLLAFARPAVAEIERQLSFLAALDARGAADADRWAAARAAVAADARFPGFTLVPQPGLVPLGADRKSNLQEFYDLASGDPVLGVPQRDDAGLLVLEESHGIVFVLLPGGRFQPFGDSKSVLLAPFLLAKHEATRAQFRAWRPGEDPSDVPLGEVWDGELHTLRHAVNRLLFPEAQAMLRRWGLALPTGVQWEYAARAGGADDTPDWAGNYSGREDGVYRSGRVGRYPANDFGLHDVLGNVAELCVDADGTGSLPARDGDGLRGAAPEQARRMVRGGHHGSSRRALSAWVAVADDQRTGGIGIRPLRALEER